MARRKPGVWAKLPADLQRELDRLAEQSITVTARVTRIPVHTVERLAFGGTAKADTVARAAELLRAYLTQREAAE